MSVYIALPVDYVLLDTAPLARDTGMTGKLVLPSQIALRSIALCGV